MGRIIGILVLSLVAITSTFLFLISLVLWTPIYLFDKRLRLLHCIVCLWGYLNLKLVPGWHVSRSGKSNVAPNQTYIIISNHQSLLDILVISSLFIHFKWVSKAEIFKIPVIGWGMYLNQYIKLLRGDKSSTRNMMRESEKHLKNGSSVCIFPEGTRSTNGSVKPFKAGAFLLAKRLKIPILPIAIEGTTCALPKHSLQFHGAYDIDIKILDPILPESFEDMSASELAQLTRAKIIPHVKTHDKRKFGEKPSADPSVIEHA